MSRILIDGRFVGVGESISRYTLEILSGILKLDKKNQYTILMRPQGKKVFKKFVSENLSAFQARPRHIGGQATTYNLQVIYLDIEHYSISEQTKLLSFLNEKKYDLIHFTQFNHPVRYKGDYVISIHDLTLLGHLHRMNPIKRLGFKGVMKSAVKDSKQILTISNVTKKDIVETYGTSPNKISVVYLGVDKSFSSKVKTQKSKIAKFKKKYNVIGDYILYTGMWKKHKNLLRLFKAFEQFLSQKSKVKSQNDKSKFKSIQLVLVGKIDTDEPEVLSEISRINKLHTDPSMLTPIITTDFIEEEELPISYAGALCYVIPSLSEGFGLPPLEAMASGTPVLSSKVSAMPEILGDAALYFNPYKVSDIADKIEMIVSDEKLRLELSKRGLKHVKKYDWQKTAEKTYEIYKNVLK